METIIFRFHVKFRGSIQKDMSSSNHRRLEDMNLGEVKMSGFLFFCDQSAPVAKQPINKESSQLFLGTFFQTNAQISLGAHDANLDDFNKAIEISGSKSKGLQLGSLVQRSCSTFSPLFPPLFHPLSPDTPAINPAIFLLRRCLKCEPGFFVDTTIDRSEAKNPTVGEIGLLDVLG